MMDDMQLLANAIGSTLRTIRQNMGWNTKDAAKALNHAASWVLAYETGRHRADLKTLGQFLDAYQMKWSTFLTLVGPTMRDMEDKSYNLPTHRTNDAHGPAFDWGKGISVSERVHKLILQGCTDATIVTRTGVTYHTVEKERQHINEERERYEAATSGLQFQHRKRPDAGETA